MTDRVLGADELRDVLRLLARELGIRPAPKWQCLPTCIRCQGHNGDLYGPTGSPLCGACR